jgi:Sulfotransferase family
VATAVTEGVSTPPAPFEPIFVVGGRRSGTTLLATLLDRHSQIAVPPETHFFGHFRQRIGREAGPVQHRDLVDDFFGNQRAQDMKLDPQQLLGRFRQYPADLAHLLRSSLEEFAARLGKTRPGEKTPGHLEFVPTILEWFPRAKVICIVRDGRAAVLSAARLGWRAGDIVGLSMAWRQCVRWMISWERRYPHSFLRVRYEDLVRDPTGTLGVVDRFVGIGFEVSQLNTSVPTHAVPDWEAKWKAKSAAAVDVERLSAWRREATDEETWLMNLVMGSHLRLLDYPDTAISWRMSPRLLRYAAARFAQAARAYGPVRTRLQRLRVVTRALKS